MENLSTTYIIPLINQKGISTLPARWGEWVATAEGFLRRMAAAKPPTPRLEKVVRRMSVQALSWVLDYSLSEYSARLVLISIANHADKYGNNAFPCYETIAEEAKIDRSTVAIVLPTLEAIGELKIVRGGGPRGSNLYSLPKLGTVGNPDCQQKQPQSDLPPPIVGNSRPDSRESPPEPSLTVHEPSYLGKEDSPEQEEEAVNPRAVKDIYREMRRAFKRKFGRSVGPSVLRGKAGENFLECYGRHRDKLAPAFDEWMEQGGEYAARNKYKMAISLFLKDADELVEDLAMQGPEPGKELSDGEDYLNRIGTVRRPAGDY